MVAAIEPVTIKPHGNQRPDAARYVTRAELMRFAQRDSVAHGTSEQ